MSEHAEPQRRRLPGVGLPGVGGFVIDRANDAISLLRFLPDIATALKSIDNHVANMDHEVHMMRVGVDRLDKQVQALRGDIGNLSTDLEGVAERIERLEPHISDLSRLARPLKRMRNRSTVTERRSGEAAQLAPADPPAPAPGTPAPAPGLPAPANGMD